MNEYDSILYTIGGTPTVSLNGFARSAGFSSSIHAKLEYRNPTGSVTDRAALFMLNDAVKNGKLTRDAIAVAAVHGNMGVSVSYIARLMGFGCIIVAPESISSYNADLITSLGARLVLTPRSKGVKGALDYARQLCGSSERSFLLDQFSNETAISAYHDTLGPELHDVLGDDIDYLVCGVGSGSTISGCAQYLKKWLPNIKVAAVEPRECPVLSGGYAAAHGIEGLGVGFVPDNYNPYIVDRVIQVSTGDAIRTAQLAWSADGVSCGYSSGAALFAAAQIALEDPDARLKLAVVLPDAAWRYKGTELFKNTNR